ncbi:MAG TPA: site-specific integrase [Ilumatobacter sp.]|nr:site-specific integrase [Ilumatobacter sp.]
MTDLALRARVVLAELEALGLTVDDLMACRGQVQPVDAPPTVAEYIVTVAASYPPRTRRSYGSYWRLLEEFHGHAPIDRVTADDLQGVVDEAARRAGVRRAGSDGRASRENSVAAIRAVFTRAYKAGRISHNPALMVDKPRRLPNRRRGLSPTELTDVWEAVAATTPDPGLDLFLVRFHLETGARRMGAINLRPRDVDERRQTIWLREKFGAEREQPISASLLDALSGLARERGVRGPEEPMLRTNRRRADGMAPLSDRIYDRIFTRAQEVVPWSARTPLTAHVLRHTAITAVERVAGFAVAQAFAGHSPESVTGTYTKADISEVAAAVAELTGELHPLA